MSSQQGPPQDDLTRGVVGLAFAGMLIIGISFAFSPGPAAVPGLILGVFLSLLVIAVGRFPVPGVQRSALWMNCPQQHFWFRSSVVCWLITTGLYGSSSLLPYR